MTKYFTPLSCIHKECVTCMGGQPSLVKGCPSEDCPLYSYRFGKHPIGMPSALKTIKLFCMACIGSDLVAVKSCTGTDCNLYFYQMGKNPKRKGQNKGRDMSKQIETLKKYREKAKIK